MVILKPFSDTSYVNPWGVEPQSKEPESFILSIELRVQIVVIYLYMSALNNLMYLKSFSTDSFNFSSNFP